MNHVRHLLIGFLLAALGVWGTGGLLLAQQTGGSGAAVPAGDQKTKAGESKSPATQPPTGNKEATAAAEKKVYFAMRNEPWSRVLDWLAEQTGLPILGTTPPGTFTFIPPKDAKTGLMPQFTIPQVIDILNDGLLPKKYILIRGNQSLHIWPADEQIPEELVPTVTRADLAQRGRSEIVRLVYPLKQMLAENFGPEVRKMMGPFGKVMVLSSANQLVLQDTVGNLRSILQIIDDADNPGPQQEQATFYAHPCKYISAHEAEAQLRDFLGEPRKQPEQPAPSPPAGGFGGNFGPGGRFGFPPGGGAPTAVPSPPKTKPIHIASNDATNTVFISGPADKVALAKSMLQKIDVPVGGKETPPRLIGPPEFKTYPVPAGNAEALAKQLAEVYKAAPNLRIAAISPTQIMVYAPPEEQFKIAREIHSSQTPPVAELILLRNLDARTVADQLKAAMGDSKTGAPFIDADVARNGIIIQGTAEQVQVVRGFIKALRDAGVSTPAGNTRVLYLDKASPAAVAEMLQQILGNFRRNPVKIERPLEAPTPRPEMEKPAPTKPSAPAPPRSSTSAPSDKGAEHPTAAQEPRFFDPQQKAPAAGRNLPGNPKVPVIIKIFPNRLEITSDDQEALDQVQELVNLLVRARPGQHDFQVIPLENASAVETAKLLDQVFNGPRDQNAPPTFGPGGLFRRFGIPQPTPKEDTIRVVADPASNSLLVWASPVDLITIRSLVRRLDQGESESAGVVKLQPPIKLLNTSASDVASVIQGAFREALGLSPQNTMVGGFPGFGFFGTLARAASQQNNQKPIRLSIGVDERTNTLWVVSNKLLYDEVCKLAQEMDKMAAEKPRTVRVISTKVDPQLIEQLVDALNGRRPSRSLSPSPAPTGTGYPAPGQPASGAPTYSPGSFPPGSGTTPGGGVAPGGGPPGGGGGFGPRGGFAPGGGPPGGGGGFGPRGGGRFGGQSRGPDFFDHGVMEDPQTASPHCFFDPQRDMLTADGRIVPVAAVAPAEAEGAPSGPVAGKDSTPAAPAGKESFPAPRLGVNAVPLPQLGLVVVSGQNPEDVELVLRVIRYLEENAKGAETIIYVQPLQRADATSVVNTLNQLFQRVNVAPGGNQLIVGPTPVRPGQPAAGVPGAAAPGAAAAGIAVPFGASVFLLPLPRQNAILLAVPRARLEDVLNYIRNLDTPVTSPARAVTIPLRHAPASRVATLLGSFYSQRYGTEANQIHITADDTTNSVLVQAAPADLEEIRELIQRIDNSNPQAVFDLRIVRLKYASADTLASLLTQAIGEGFTPATAATPIVLGQPAAAGRAPVLPLAAPGAAAAPRPTTTTPMLKAGSVRFVTSEGKVIHAGLLEDVRITSDSRTNSLIVTAPENVMSLILEVINALDVVPTATAEAKVYFLKKLDAATAASMLQQLYTGAAAAAPTAPRPAGAPGAPAPTPTPAAGAAPGTPGGPLLLVFPGMEPPEAGATIIPVRVTIEPRTNALIYAGSRNDVDLITAILDKLENSKVEGRRFEIYRLKNAQAPDVANALTTFLAQEVAYLSGSTFFNGYEQLQQQVTLTPEPINNLLLISATPAYLEKVLRLVAEMDVLPPQVVIQALIAEVDLSGTEEFGVELGLQSPVLFQRSVLPSGTTANSTTFDAAVPGFNFNNVNLPLGQATLTSPSVIGVQGLQNLGVGRISPTSSVGGFVFSAASDSINILVRALATQGRIDILSRPQIMTSDNQQALIQVGQYYPYITGSVTATAITGLPTVSNTINYQNTGVLLTVTPKINPDGSVIMRVIPQVISPTTSTTQITSGIFATAFNVETVETTVIAHDGETVAIGGLISKRDQKSENKIPYLGDLPVVGALFRYRTESKTKTELLVILTPHIVRTRAEADRILAEEARRMDWILGDVLKAHGTSGMEPVMPLPPATTPCVPVAPVTPAPAPEELPAPRPQPPAGPATSPAPAAGSANPPAAEAPGNTAGRTLPAPPAAR
jgi:general secretion pathway protein D